MAYTKIKVIRNHLKRCLDYTANPAKTEVGIDLNNALAYRTAACICRRRLF